MCDIARRVKHANALWINFLFVSHFLDMRKRVDHDRSSGNCFSGQGIYRTKYIFFSSLKHSRKGFFLFRPSRLPFSERKTWTKRPSSIFVLPQRITAFITPACVDSKNQGSLYFGSRNNPFLPQKKGSRTNLFLSLFFSFTNVDKHFSCLFPFSSGCFTREWITRFKSNCFSLAPHA